MTKIRIKNYSATIDNKVFEAEIDKDGIANLIPITGALPVKYYDIIEKTQFEKDEYIVPLFDSGNGGFKKGYIYKQRSDYYCIIPYLDDYGHEGNGWSVIDFNEKTTYRMGSKEEGIEYERIGKPFDTTTLKKEDEWEEGDVLVNENGLKVKILAISKSGNVFTSVSNDNVTVLYKVRTKDSLRLDGWRKQTKITVSKDDLIAVYCKVNNVDKNNLIVKG